MATKDQILRQPDEPLLTAEQLHDQSKGRLLALDGQHDHLYSESPAFHPTFNSVFTALWSAGELRLQQLQVDMGMKPSEAKKRLYVGLIREKIDLFDVVLNWTPQKRGSIPPSHLAVSMGDSSLGVLGPYVDRRVCWHCNAYRAVNRKTGQVHYVQPSRPCFRCGNKDWVALTVQQEDLIEAAGTWMARRLNKDTYFERFGQMNRTELQYQLGD